MLIINIPGREQMEIKNIVFDYNGTVATDGIISEETKKNIIKLKELADIYIVTADTNGTVRENCASLGVKIRTFPKENAGAEKKRIVESLNARATICIGNGYNDMLMAEKCALFICILGKEGCYGQLLSLSDVVVTSIDDALELILKPHRLIATLRS
ncbi:MAG: HAD family hydrolase [Dehalobacterium sp.]|jgi:soluble P-type ATPase